MPTTTTLTATTTTTKHGTYITPETSDGEVTHDNTMAGNHGGERIALRRVDVRELQANVATKRIASQGRQQRARLVPNGSPTLKQRVVGHNGAKWKESGPHINLQTPLLVLRFDEGGRFPKFKRMTASQFHRQMYAEMSETQNDDGTIDKNKKAQARFHTLSDIELTLFLRRYIVHKEANSSSGPSCSVLVKAFTW